MNDNEQTEAQLTEEQREIIDKYHAAAAQVVDWVNAAPDLDTIASSLIYATIATRRTLAKLNEETGVSEEELDRIVKWLQGRYIDWTLISSILTGHTSIIFPENDSEPSFALTPRGRQQRDVLQDEADADADE